MPSLIEVQDLVKQYPGVRAVDGVSFEIEEGSCFGMLGPNGAGKTTTVEIIEGVKEPTSGTVLYRGAERDRRFKEESGIQFQSTALQDYLKVREVLELFGALYQRTLPLPELVEMCALGEFLERDHKKLSGGQRQRLLLAVALVNDPAVVFLDEPTTGLDPQARHNFWDVVKRIRAAGKTLVLTTHYMEEAYLLCDEIAILDHGQIIAMGSPRELLARQFEGSVVELPNKDFEPPEDFPWITYRKQDFVEIQTTDINQTLRYLMERNVSLKDVRVKSRTLEDLFLELTGRELRT
jgi:ABC-2 type transport system ATP-binding protein